MFGSTSVNGENKNDTSLFVQKPHLRTNYIENNNEYIDMKNQFRIKNLPDPISRRESASKYYVDNKINDASIMKDSAHVGFNYKNLDDVRFINFKLISKR